MIDSPEAITPQWLDEAIAPQGVSRRGEGGIESVNVREIGMGVGQLSRIFRVEIAGGEDYPASVVVKLPSDDPQAFRMCRRMSLYRREFLSYRRVTPALGVATPNLLFGEFDVRTHRFVLVLDDVANWWDGQARGRDQLQGADASEARAAVRAAARIHAPFWGQTDRTSEVGSETQIAKASSEYPLSEFKDIFRPLVRWALQFVYVKSLPTAHARFPEAFSSRHRELAAAFGPFVAAQLAAASSGPKTFIHGDYRLDNMFFSPHEAERFAIVDWQAAAIGCGLYDLAYFVCTSVSRALRPRIEGELLEKYHGELCARGVREFSIEKCRELYRASVLACLVRQVIVAGSANLDNERAHRLTQTCLRRTLYAIDGVDGWAHIASVGRRSALGWAVTRLAHHAAKRGSARGHTQAGPGLRTDGSR